MRQNLQDVDGNVLRVNREYLALFLFLAAKGFFAREWTRMFANIYESCVGAACGGSRLMSRCSSSGESSLDRYFISFPTFASIRVHSRALFP